jgi:hypothetical protein
MFWPFKTRTICGGVLACAVVATTTVVGGAPYAVETWFDAATARELMDARSAFDAAELNAIAEFDKSMGAHRAVVAMPPDQYRDQVSSPALRERTWTDEQRRRSAVASEPRNAAVDAAEEQLRRRTLAALKRFFARERSQGRISASDYARLVAGELGADYFPSIRCRKWAGPAVIGFRSPIRTPEYRAVLAEVRRLWAAHVRGAPVMSVATEPGFYRNLLTRG